MKWLLSIATFLGGIAALYYLCEKIFFKPKGRIRAEEEVAELMQEARVFILTNLHTIKSCHSCDSYASDLERLFDMMGNTKTMIGLRRVKKLISKISVSLAKCPDHAEVSIELFEYEGKIEQLISSLVVDIPKT